MVIAKVLEPADGMPAITIHGLMDNTGSFDLVVPLLPSNICQNWIKIFSIYLFVLNCLTYKSSYVMYVMDIYDGQYDGDHSLIWLRISHQAYFKWAIGNNISSIKQAHKLMYYLFVKCWSHCSHTLCIPVLVWILQNLWLCQWKTSWQNEKHQILLNFTMISQQI